MLGRRQLRAKAMQALYAYYRGNDEVGVVETHMMRSIKDLEILYMALLELTLAVKTQAEIKIEIGLNKNFPTPEEKNPNRRFVQNPLFKILEINTQLRAFREGHKELNWEIEEAYPRKIFRSFIETEQYKCYMAQDDVNFKDHSDIVCFLFEECIAPNEKVASFFEDKNLSWVDDLHIANTMVCSTLRSFTPYSNEATKLFKVVMEQSHLDFAKELIRQSIRYENTLYEIIGTTTENWELERMALVDKIILQMALAEFLYFPSIPTKVTMNEYVELAKVYSTESSQIFVNGILDKALKELLKQQKIKKSARGLM